MADLGKQLINITDWSENEVRVEIFGNGSYIPKNDIGQWIRDNADRIATEVVSNIETTLTEV